MYIKIYWQFISVISKDSIRNRPFHFDIVYLDTHEKQTQSLGHDFVIRDENLSHHDVILYHSPPIEVGYAYTSRKCAHLTSP